MEIEVLNIDDDEDRLTFRRLDDVVRVLHHEQTVADVPVRDMLDHLARVTSRRWVQRRRRWRDLSIGLTRDQKVVLAVRHRIATNTLTGEELHDLWVLLTRGASVPSHRAGAAHNGGAQPL